MYDMMDFGELHFSHFAIPTENPASMYFGMKKYFFKKY